VLWILVTNGGTGAMARCKTMPQASASSSGWGVISINLDSDVNSGADMRTSSFKEKNNQC